jgi:beta-lactamase class A
VEVSDNPAANLLVRELGGLEAWRSWWPTIGDTVTRVDRLEPELNRPDPLLDTTTPAQTVRNLRTVLLGERLSPVSRQRLEGWLLASPTGPARLKAGAPAGARVAHKTGTYDAVGLNNDIGLFRLPSGEPMLVAAYFAGPASATQAERDAVIADAARSAVMVLHG